MATPQLQHILSNQQIAQQALQTVPPDQQQAMINFIHNTVQNRMQQTNNKPPTPEDGNNPQTINMAKGNNQMPAPGNARTYETSSGARWKYVMEADPNKLVNEDVLTQEDKKMRKQDNKEQSEGYLACLSCAGCCPNPFIVEEGFAGLVMTMGRYDRTVDPGQRTINPCTEKIIKVDMRAQTQHLYQQKLLTKDSVAITVKSFCVYKVSDAYKVTFKIGALQPVINFYAQDSMKSCFTQHKLSEILMDRRPIEQSMVEILRRLCQPYGIYIINFSATGIDIPQRLERAMMIESEAHKKRKAKLIDAQANLNTASQIRASADELGKNDISIQLQFYEV